MNTNLLDLNNDVLNIIAGYVKKDNFEKTIRRRRTGIKWKKTIVSCFFVVWLSS